MFSSKISQLVLLLALIVTIMSGTVQLGSGTNVTVADPTSSSSLSNSYTLWNPVFGSVSFLRSRTTVPSIYDTTNYFGEFYQWNYNSSCKIECGPYAYPITAGTQGPILCQRDLSYYGQNPTEATYCVPDLSASFYACNLATQNLYSSLDGLTCNLGILLNQNPYMSIYSSYPFDCCRL